MSTYNLLNGLFSSNGQEKIKGAAQSSSSTKQSASTQKQEENAVAVTKCTWRIEDKLLDDFMILTRIEEQTQAELINEILRESLVKHADRLQQYKQLQSKKDKGK